MKKRDRFSQGLRWLAAAAAIAIASSGGVLAEPGPVKIGEPEVISVSTEHPYFATADSDTLEWTVRFPGATYVRIHFSEFDLAPGDRVWISDPAGRRMRFYEERGPHGNGDFWAHTVPGDTALLRLEIETGGGYGFSADQAGAGVVPIFGDPEPTPESVCGLLDWRDVECYRDSYPTEFEKARAAVKIVIGCCSACTSFKVSDSGQFMTNNHCTTDPSIVEAIMEYQNQSCDAGPAGDIGSVFGDRLVATDYTLDYTLYTTTGDSSAIPCLELDDRLAPAGERIYIAGHPSAGVKKLSIESTHSANPTGLCEVDASPYNGRSVDSDIGYYCDTTNGSSGSPVISGDTDKVVGLHHFGGCLNSGARSDLILGEIGNQLDPCTGGGQPGECGNGTKESGEQCDGSDLGGATCKSLGYDGGTLGCTGNCTYDESGCCIGKGKNCSAGSNNENCKNHKDDDGDGLIDCDDPDCATNKGCL